VGSVVVNGVRLAYEMSGDGDPVLLIAGTGMPASAWELHGAPALRDVGYRVITFDNRGTGTSDGPPGPYTVEEMAVDTAGLLEHFGCGAALVVGLSLGGSIAQELARTRPDLVSAMVLWVGAGRSSAFFRKLQAAERDIASLVAVPASWHLAEYLLISLPFDSLQKDDALVEAVAELIDAGVSWSGDGRSGQFSADVAWDSADHADLYPQIGCPCLVVAHELDLIYPPHGARAAANAMGRGSFLEIPGVAHGQTLQAAPTVVPAIIDFLAAARDQ
jgi:pimeloyl-ACP methyl ester carboxylesterase